MPKLDTILLFFVWGVWFSFAVLTMLLITQVLFAGRKILVVNTWVVAILSWILWNAIFDTVILVDPGTWRMGFGMKIVILPNSLQEWVLAVGSVAVYFFTVILGINQSKEIQKI